MGRFEDIYQRHLPAVFRYAVSCVGRRDIAEEITSEAFLSLYRNLDQIDDALLPGWLITTVRNRAVDYWRRQRLEQKVAELADPPIPGGSSGPAQPTNGGLPGESVESWLASCKHLQPAHRVCLILRYVHGMTRAEIARQIGLSETQVKGHLQYALQLLRKELAQSRPQS